MSIVDPRSVIYQIIAGRYQGRRCVLANDKASGSDHVRVIVDDDQFVTIGIGELAQLAMPGWQESTTRRSYGLHKYLQHEKGSGSNMLRTSNAAQPRSLKVGDQLATKEYVMQDLRRGYNSSVLLYLSLVGWIELASRLPLALSGNKKYKLPAELKAGDRLITGCVVARESICRLNWVDIFLDDLENCIDVPAPIPLALA
jgi:hypothetical protein